MSFQVAIRLSSDCLSTLSFVSRTQNDGKENQSHLELLQFDKQPKTVLLKTNDLSYVVVM